MVELSNNSNDWFTMLSKGAACITFLWAYTKFIAERGLIPSIQFEIALGTKGTQDDKNLVEILLHLKNLGSSTLVVHNLRIDLLYLNQDDKALIFGERNKSKKGRVNFKNSLKKDVLIYTNVSPDKNVDDQHKSQPHPETSQVSGQRGVGKISKGTKFKRLLQIILFSTVTTQNKDRGIEVIGYDTFVQPQIEQIYTFGTVVPKSATYILVRSSFEYKVHPSRLQLWILSFSRVLGLTQFNLTHITEPHTCERIFNLQ